MTPDAALACLRKAAKAETQKRLAERLDISPQYLCDVLNGRRDPEWVLRRFGFERVVTYRPIRKGA